MVSYKDRLPLYLAQTPAWVDLAEVMDEVLGELVHEPAQKLANIRDVNNWHPKAFEEKVGRAMLDGGDRMYEGVEWNDPVWRVRSAMMLGFNFYNIYALAPETFDQFIKMAVQFFPEQGTDSWADFLGFASDSLIQVIPLWTRDYVDFFPEGHPQIGTKIEDGGEWYPTSHVDVKINASYSSNISLANFLDLLKFAAPINMVFRDVTIEYSNIQVGTLYIAMAGQMSVTWGVW